VRAKGDAASARAELELLRQEIAIRDARSARVPPKHRPHYTPEERLLILALRAAGGWTAQETARRFQVTPATIASWTRRADHGDDALLATRTPVNRFPDFVAAVVERVKVAGASFGRRRIANILARAGLAISASSVRRLLARGSGRLAPVGGATPSSAPAVRAPAPRSIHAKRADPCVIGCSPLNHLARCDRATIRQENRDRETA
jgi:transposase-like protein